ncbi:hypothetical protein FQR65_LT12653 [Abscondita terminalis]|nr:hypothetical protein FQR65_LT12653 [Abscondita terminalis]
MIAASQSVEYLVADTTAFIENAPLQDIARNIVTCQEVIDEITNKRQLRRLIVLPYNLIIKNVDPENVVVVTEFSKKTGDYLSLSATDLKVMALTYQLEKEHVGIEHIRNEPIMQKTVNIIDTHRDDNLKTDVVGFYQPDKLCLSEESKLEEDTEQQLQTLNLDNQESDDSSSACDDDNDIGWITPSNIVKAKKLINTETAEQIFVKVACMTTDFAMQNVLKQMNLHISALDGRIIKQIKTYVLRCYTCFKTTSIMTKVFCPKCGNKTLKRVAVTIDADGNQQIHINARRPLTGRGKKFSLPTIKGGKHSNNPHLVEDQPFPDQRPTRLAKTKTNALNEDYIAGFSPFVMRDVNSKSAQLKIRPHSEVKHWMRRNPNEAGRRK